MDLRPNEAEHDTLIAPDQTAAEPEDGTRYAPTGEPGVDLERGTLRLENGLRYAKRASLGQGGMGVVELSTDRLIGRDVAIKTLRPRLGDDPRTVERFLREARIQGQLEHPAIVPVYDLGRTEAGTLYFAMKRVKGRTLREILTELRERSTADPRFSRRRLLSAFSQICQAIAYAHSRGVVHRDLKPDNLMFGEHGEVYVLDWGIARLLGGDDEGERVEIEVGADATRQGAIIGTLGYMSPEQARGDHEQVDGRSDVWSLGAILFELLALEPLIERRSVAQMLAATIEGVDGDPSRVDPDVAPELAALCVRATAGRREDRLASAELLSEAIERYLDGDRDASMRREKAEEHARAAEQAARRAFEQDDLELRRLAARETGVALALDPGHVGARKTLLELITHPPKQLPEATRASLDADRARTMRSFYWRSIAAMVSYAPAFLLLAVLFEWRERWVLPLGLAAGAVYIGLCIYGLRHRRPSAHLPLLLHAFVAIILLLLARLLSPLLVLPVLAAINSMVTSGYRGDSPRWMIAAVGAMPLLGAGLLELFGVWSPTMVWTDGALQLRSALIDVGDSPLIVPALLLLSVFPIPVATTLMGRVQDLSDTLAREAHVQRWQLEQFVASE